MFLPGCDAILDSSIWGHARYVYVSNLCLLYLWPPYWISLPRPRDCALNLAHASYKMPSCCGWHKANFVQIRFFIQWYNVRCQRFCILAVKKEQIFQYYIWHKWIFELNTPHFCYAKDFAVSFLFFNGFA